MHCPPSNLFNESKNISKKLTPSSEFVKDNLEQVYSTVVAVNLSPGGGERFGNLSIAAVSTLDAPSIEEAILALWKVDYCLGEELPYTLWDWDRMRWLSKAYSNQYAEWMMSEKPDDFINWLEGRSRETIQAQQKLEQPLNPPVYYPDEKAVLVLELNSLLFLQAESLQLILNNAWNDSQGLFLYEDYWYLAKWGTSA